MKFVNKANIIPDAMGSLYRKKKKNAKTYEKVETSQIKNRQNGKKETNWKRKTKEKNL